MTKIGDRTAWQKRKLSERDASTNPSRGHRAGGKTLKLRLLAQRLPNPIGVTNVRTIVTILG